MECKLITGRTLKQGEGIEIGKTSEEYFNNVATIFLSEEDMEKMGVDEDSAVKVSSEGGSCVVYCKKGDLDEGMAFMPLGPWASQILSTDTSGTGIPQSKGISVEISESDEEVPSIQDIMESMGGA